MAQSTSNGQRLCVLNSIGLYDPIKIANTLQGSILRASTTKDHTLNPQTIAIKITSITKHGNPILHIGNNTYFTQENILLEQSILKYLTEHEQCPPSIVKFIRFLKTKTDFYLVMEDAGTSSLFRFVKNAHVFIKSNTIEISHWKAVVRVIFKQMIEAIEFIHGHNVCHNDISLENFVINDVRVDVHNNGKIRFNIDEIQIKLCDFGLAELHNKTDCLSSKYCGKTQYKSPEIINKNKVFEGKKNDIWCVGICLFILSFGSPPWNVAHIDDVAFKYVMNGHIIALLKAWGLSNYIDEALIDLCILIFQYEEQRINLSQIKRHPWFVKVADE